MYAHAWPEDPSYTGTIARFIRETVEEVIHYEVVPDPALTSRLLEIDTVRQMIKVRPGQPLRQFREIVDRASWFVLGNKSDIGGGVVVPEFQVQPRLRLVTSEPEPAPEACPSCRRVG